MRGRGAVALLILALVGISGCLGPDETPEPRRPAVIRDDPPAPIASAAPPPPQPSSSPAPAPEDENRTNETPPPPPLPVRIVASATTGPAPLAVTLTLRADTHQDNASWTLDTDGDGRSEAHGNGLPHTHDTIYGEGDWTVTFRATLGNETHTVRIAINVTAPAPTGPPPPITIRDTVTGAWIEGLGYVPDENAHAFQLPRAVQTITLTLTFEGTAVDLDYELYAPDGRRVARAAHYNEPTGQAPDPFTGPGEPAIQVKGEDARLTGEWTVRVAPALAVEGDYTLHITFT